MPIFFFSLSLSLSFSSLAFKIKPTRWLIIIIVSQARVVLLSHIFNTYVYIARWERRRRKIEREYARISFVFDSLERKRTEATHGSNWKMRKKEDDQYLRRKEHLVGSSKARKDQKVKFLKFIRQEKEQKKFFSLSLSLSLSCARVDDDIRHSSIFSTMSSMNPNKFLLFLETLDLRLITYHGLFLLRKKTRRIVETCWVMQQWRNEEHSRSQLRIQIRKSMRHSQMKTSEIENERERERARQKDVYSNQSGELMMDNVRWYAIDF